MRAHHGSFSFEVPPGSVDETTVVLSRPVVLEKGKQVDASAYPLSLSIVTDSIGKAPGPLPYLQHKLTQLRAGLTDYKAEFCEAASVTGNKAARAQFSFKTQFELHQLVLVWFAGERLFTVTASTTKPGISEGWQRVQELAASIRVEAN